MTEMVMPLSGATTTRDFNWDTINWGRIKAHVKRLQIRIAKAFREGKRNKAKALQRILTHSFYAKLLAVKRVTQSKGAKTPGIDKIVWRTPKQKIDAALSLKRRGYKTQPLKRIHIPKKQKGKLRPLSIPAMNCRAQQALYLLALEPISETIADKNAYGFRPLRSTVDALEQCFLALSKKNSAEYILEGDIHACFDKISHQWLVENTPMDTVMLKKWLTAGYIEKGMLYPTLEGTPQGGQISPALLNVTLSGLETAVKAATSKRNDKVNVVVYCDDFIITGASREILESKVKPVVESFLRERGLSLSQEKTKITHINEGFDFLGVNIRKYKGKLIRKPAKDNVKKFLENIRETVKTNPTAKTENLIHLLNPKIRGWANYHRYYCSKKTFSYVSLHIFKVLWRWAIRRHPEKSAKWVRKKYFRTKSYRNWVFSSKVKDKDGNDTYLDLVEISKTPIRRHIKIKAEATPYNPGYKEYLADRQERQKRNNLFVSPRGGWSPWWEMSTDE